MKLATNLKLRNLNINFSFRSRRVAKNNILNFVSIHEAVIRPSVTNIHSSSKWLETFENDE